ncbi:hypothetical protein DRW41_15930 [Neobacillus piezotolerans]|uniref:Uncharacterized protein n=1 Tax=Neobacillus piezotolerans TaxID=2259171 RepID=A0A3D8GNM0_9BACI|nr:hypothetical protein [Neobacillus piezotolerans]RDU36073.1 hypothetical protein DRW41_15930 [Neobacillus piezotolerans]
MGTIILKNEKSPIMIVVWAIILFVSSSFIPFILVSIIHSSFFKNPNQWLFIAPGQGYVTFMAGMFWISFVLFLYVFIQYKYQMKFIRWIALALFSLSIPLFMFGSAHYYYFDENGLHYNELDSFNQTTVYDWSSFKEVKQVYANRPTNNARYLDSYQFIMPDNRHIVVPYGSDLRRNEKRILVKLERSQVKVTDNYYE